MTIGATQKYNGIDIIYSEEITFNAIIYKNDEDVIEKIVYKKQNCEMTLDNALFEKTDYAQTGWAKTIGGYKEYKLGERCSANQDIELYAFWNKTKISVSLSGKFEDDWMGTDYGGWATLDSLEEYYTHETSLDIDLYHTIFGTVDYQIRIYDDTAKSELAVYTYSSGNGEGRDHSVAFADIALDDVDNGHKIIVQVRCKKQHALWGGGLTISSPHYTLEFIK